ncbi:glycogenin glucosyltransferase [Maudiozyma humilis]|uniref:glycogenin glucosyltransferase n=1 Tax=Maudiozyma humilis TaxID=51915 RepID=A0AAV5RTW6_MAUHU|nr:glycogenin glucosyltransferase [Kazachstania humilis]
MPRKLAVATLLYSLDYLPGVLTLGHQVNTFLRVRNDDPQIERCLLVTEWLYEHELSVASKNALHTLYNRVVLINPLMENETLIRNNNQNLEMLQRPELAFTLIKIKLWNQTMYDQILYLDADTLPMTTDLFDLFAQFPTQTAAQVAAAPDIGWPDMFNSGVMLLAPDAHLYHALHRFTIDHISIDGADQGIINQFFNQNCRRANDTSKRQWIPLPFLYNVTTPNTGYQCPPAMKYFQQQIKLIHFIGANKPWKRDLQVTDENSNYAKQWFTVYEDYAAHVQLDQGVVVARPKETVQYRDPVETSDNSTQQENHDNSHQENHDNHENHDDSPHEYHAESHHEEQPQPQHNEPIVEPAEEEFHEPHHEPESEKIDLPLQFKDWLTTFISKEETPVPIPHYDDNSATVTDASSGGNPGSLHEPPYAQQAQDYEERQFSSSGPLDSDDEGDAESIVSSSDEEEAVRRGKRRTQPRTPATPVSPAPTPVQEYVPNYKFTWESTDYQKKVERIFPGEIFEYEVEQEEEEQDDTDTDTDTDDSEIDRQIAVARLRRKLHEDEVEKQEEAEKETPISTGATSDGLPNRDDDIPERVFPSEFPAGAFPSGTSKPKFSDTTQTTPNTTTTPSRPNTTQFKSNKQIPQTAPKSILKKATTNTAPTIPFTLPPLPEEPSEYNSDYGDE